MRGPSPAFWVFDTSHLGANAVELLPVHQFLPEQRLLDLGLTNYWVPQARPRRHDRPARRHHRQPLAATHHSKIGFFAPHAAYRVAPPRAPRSTSSRFKEVDQFKEMVKALHRAGLEVILDVVDNHTAEGSPGEPPIAFQGLANDVYYRFDPGDPSRYLDTTGTNNTLNVDRPEENRLNSDSRYDNIRFHDDGESAELAHTGDARPVGNWRPVHELAATCRPADGRFRSLHQ